MNIKIKIEEEKAFKGKNKIFFENLNKKGIYTVEDYINSSIEQMAIGANSRKEHRAYQQILKYKYLGEPLILDVLLEKEYNYDDPRLIQKIHTDLFTLGFGSYYANTITKKLFKENGLIRMIDIIELIDLQNKIGMQEFYIEYYREKKQKETIENNKQSLDSLKRELINLMTQKEILEAKISTLLEQINTIEGEKTINGRK